ncbi:DUF6887 family protein [Kovacikia minuta]|uniref:DUF6887 family protein n=1 Tax=Kovacikia minuta TaxID=2931930 RepID=UPI0036F2B69D
MTHPDFKEMTRKDLLAYLLEHRDDEEVFHAYRTHLRSQEVAASRFSISLTKQRLILVSA